MWPLFLLSAKGKQKEMTGTQHVGTYKHKFLQYITKKNVLVLFHYQNNFEMISSSAIWWRHLPVACNNFFEACVSGNFDFAAFSRLAFPPPTRRKTFETAAERSSFQEDESTHILPISLEN
jgi:hypothetical protein